MSWNYRVMWHHDRRYSVGGWYGIHEVYYSSGQVRWTTKPIVEPGMPYKAADLDALKATKCPIMRRALAEPVLDYETGKTV